MNSHRLPGISLGVVLWVSALAFFARGSWAKPAPQPAFWKSELQYETNLKYSERIDLEVRGTAISVNGFKLSPNDTLINHRPLLDALTVTSGAHSPICSSGRFIHVVRHGSRTRTEQGCLSDRRFSVLKAAFVTLRSRSGKK